MNNIELNKIEIKDNYKEKNYIRNKKDIIHILEYGNKSIKDIKQYKNLITYHTIDISDDNKLFEYYDCSNNQVYLQTNNIVGFFGCENNLMKIYSRFVEHNNSKKDYFLYYLIEKTLYINLINLNHFLSLDNTINYLILLFPKFLKEAFKQGLYKEYVTNHYNSQKLKGILDINEFIKSNIPFTGNISYKIREHTVQNKLFYLVRWTIESIKKSKFANVIFNDWELRKIITQINSFTNDYNKFSIRRVLILNEKNRITHPYYLKYRELQDLCIKILNFELIKYDSINSNKEIYGCIFDASILWEEYINKLLIDKNMGYKHSDNRGKINPIFLFKNSREQPRYIDFFNDNTKTIIDTKYKFLKNNKDDYNQMLAYMYLTKYKKTILLYPNDDNDDKKHTLNEKSYGGCIYQIGFNIPKDAIDYEDFKKKISKSENKVIKKIQSVENS